MRFLTLAISLLLIQTTLIAQETKRCFRVEFELGSSKLDTGIRDNEKTMEEMLSYLSDAVSRPDTKVLNVVFVGSASPEGPSALNLRLANARSDAAEKFVRERVALPDSVVSRQSHPQDWSELPSLLGEGTVSGSLAAVLSSGVSSGEIQHAVERLDSGRVWKALLEDWFPSMRNSGIVIVTTSRIGELAVETSLSSTNLLAMKMYSDRPLKTSVGGVSQLSDIDGFSTDSGSENAPSGSGRGGWCAAIKTNMLHDAALMPDLAAEFPLGKHWSLSAGWTYAWWSRDSAHDYWRYAGGNAALRWWFGKRHREDGRLNGHHIGIKGTVFTFDFETGGRGYLGGFPGGKLTDQACWSAGVEYGYSLPVAKHLNIDFSLSAGYIGGKYWKYAPEDRCYVAQNESALRFVGPTSAEISLVWIIGNRKGGRK